MADTGMEVEAKVLQKCAELCMGSLRRFPACDPPPFHGQAELQEGFPVVLQVAYHGGGPIGEQRPEAAALVDIELVYGLWLLPHAEKGSLGVHDASDLGAQ